MIPFLKFCTSTFLCLTSSSEFVSTYIITLVENIFQESKKAYLDKRERGELFAQKIDFLKQNMLGPVN